MVAVASGRQAPLPGYSGYSVSKAGLIMPLKSVAVEYARVGIRANSICPGPVESEMVDSRVAAESERLGVPAETLREAIPEKHSAGPHGQRGRHCEDGAVPGFGRVLVSDGAVPQSVGRHDH